MRQLAGGAAPRDARPARRRFSTGEPGQRIGVALFAALVGSAGLLGGCSTLANGTTDEVYAVSVPAGAKASVSFGNATCLTPCKFEVNRGTPFTIVFAKDGYDLEQIEVKTRSTASEASLSHEITADYVGRIADFQDGSQLVHDPNPVSVTLKKTAPPEQ